MGVRELAAALIELVLPGDCAGCGAPVVPWCPACSAGLGPPRRPVLPGGPPVLAVGRYSGPLRSAVLRYKERGRRDLAVPLAGLLAGALAEHARPQEAGFLWLVPAPSRPAAARARGGDHVLRLCHATAALLHGTAAAPRAGPAERRTAVPGPTGVTVASALALARGARDSVGLDAGQRATNLQGRLRVRAARLPPAGARVLLVDDVVTTGATLRACRAALAGAGVAVRGAVVLCDATGGDTARAVRS